MKLEAIKVPKPWGYDSLGTTAQVLRKIQQ